MAFHLLGVFILFILTVNGQEDEQNKLSYSLNELIIELVELNKECRLIVLDLSYEKIDLELSLRSLQEKSRTIMYQDNLSDWRYTISCLVSKLCIQTLVIFESNSQLIDFTEEIYDRSLISHPYNYFFFVNDVSELEEMKILWDIIHLTIIQTIPQSEWLSMYQINPYERTNKLVLTNLWSLQDSDFLNELQYKDYHGDLMGNTLRVAYMLHPPYTILESQEVLSGYEYSIAAHVGQSLNFQVSPLESIDGNWGAVDDNGSWNGIIGMAQRREAEIAIGALTRNFEREIAIDYTTGYSEQFLTFVTHIPLELPKWSSLLWPFEIYVWILIITTMFLYTTIYIIILKIVHCERNINISLETTNIWGSFFNQGIKHPKRASLKIILGTWFLCSFCIVASYGGSLISFLTLSNKEKPIDSLEDLSKSDRKVIIVGGTFYGSIFEFSEDAIYRTLWKNIETTSEQGISCTSNFNCIQQVNDNKEYAYITDGDVFMRFYLKKNNLKSVYTSKAKFFSSEYAIALRKNSPILQQFNRKIQTFLEMGLIQKWKTEFSHIYLVLDNNDQTASSTSSSPPEDSKEDTASENPRSAISLNHLQGLFFVGGIGLFLSGLTFLWEMMMFSNSSKR